MNSYEKLFIYTAVEKPMEVVGYNVQLSAEIFGQNQPVSIRQHVTKRAPGADPNDPVRHPIMPGGDINATDGAIENITSIERLHFQTATQNNGKRKMPQQYYQLKLELIATLSDNEEVIIAEVKSSPLVVRGRGPGHYVQQDNGESATPFPNDYTQPVPQTAGIDGSTDWGLPIPTIEPQILSAPILGTDDTPFAWNVSSMDTHVAGSGPTIMENPYLRTDPMFSANILMSNSNYFNSSGDLWQADPIDTQDEDIFPRSPISQLTQKFCNDVTWN